MKIMKCKHWVFIIAKDAIINIYETAHRFRKPMFKFSNVIEFVNSKEKNKFAIDTIDTPPEKGVRITINHKKYSLFYNKLYMRVSSIFADAIEEGVVVLSDGTVLKLKNVLGEGVWVPSPNSDKPDIKFNNIKMKKVELNNEDCSFQNSDGEMFYILHHREEKDHYEVYREVSDLPYNEWVEFSPID